MDFSILIENLTRPDGSPGIDDLLFPRHPRSLNRRRGRRGVGGTRYPESLVADARQHETGSKVIQRAGRRPDDEEERWR